MKTPPLQNISVSEIIAPLFDMRFFRDDRPLQTSIQNFGVLNPLRLLSSEQGFKVIDGWARVSIAKHLGQSQLSCFIYNVDDVKLTEVFSLCLELNHWDREFNLIEKALALQVASEVFGDGAIPFSFWYTVGIREDVRTIHQYRELLKLPLSVKKYAVNNEIPLHVVLGFLRFPPEQREDIASQLFVLPLNRNKLAEVLSLVQDLSKREHKTPLEILGEAWGEVVQENNAVQKEQRLRRYLHKRRYPYYDQRVSAFNDKIKTLPLNDVTQIVPTPYFEDDVIEVHSKIRSFRDVEALKNTFESPAWKIILEDE